MAEDILAYTTVTFLKKKKRKNLVPRGTLKLHNGLFSSFSLTGKVIPPFEYFSLHRSAGCGILLFESYKDFFETKGIRSAVSRAKECLPQTCEHFYINLLL